MKIYYILDLLTSRLKLDPLKKTAFFLYQDQSGKFLCATKKKSFPTFA